jgi:hypothetical protein
LGKILAWALSESRPHPEGHHHWQTEKECEPDAVAHATLLDVRCSLTLGPTWNDLVQVTCREHEVRIRAKNARSFDEIVGLTLHARETR